ncbi:MAG TPA: hypothetical protein VM533_18245 [Fimbriiglobus sp.]|nr:hypothetical protein [Fimbriiglobus sp.]
MGRAPCSGTQACHQKKGTADGDETKDGLRGTGGADGLAKFRRQYGRSPVEFTGDEHALSTESDNV